MKFAKTLLTLAGATILLGALIGTASAGRLSSSSQTLRATAREVRFSGAFGTTTCALTVEGSFHSRTMTKTAGQLVGYVTRAAIGSCAVGSATVLTETLPWHIRYSSFTGTLPNITSIAANVVGLSYQIREPSFGITCLARSTEAQPGRITANREVGGAVTSANVGGTIGTNCGIEGTMEGTSTTFTVLNSVSRISVTLI